MLTQLAPRPGQHWGQRLGHAFSSFSGSLLCLLSPSVSNPPAPRWRGPARPCCPGASAWRRCRFLFCPLRRRSRTAASRPCPLPVGRAACHDKCLRKATVLRPYLVTTFSPDFDAQFGGSQKTAFGAPPEWTTFGFGGRAPPMDSQEEPMKPDPQLCYHVLLVHARPQHRGDPRARERYQVGRTTGCLEARGGPAQLPAAMA
jgi:hypothetical protein